MLCSSWTNTIKNMKGVFKSEFKKCNKKIKCIADVTVAANFFVAVYTLCHQRAVSPQSSVEMSVEI